MGYLLDIVIICILIIAVIVGVRKGFVKSAVKFVGRILAICVSGILGGAVASWLFYTFFREPFLERVSGMLSTATQGLEAEMIMASLPDFLQRALEGQGFTIEYLSTLLSTQQASAAELIVEAVEPVLVGILKVMCVIVLFMLLMIIVRILSDVFDRMFNLPLLGPVNGLLGGVFGLLSAMLILWIVLAIVNMFLPMTTETMQAAINGYIQETILAKIFFGFNPIESLIG